MDRKFFHLEYDLSQNILRNEYYPFPNIIFYSYNEPVTLFYHSLINSFVYVMKNFQIVEEIMETLNSLENPESPTDSDIIKMKELESKAIKKYEEYCWSRSFYIGIVYKAKDHIHSLLMHIFEFLSKGVTHEAVPVSRYLINLTFNSQGTINLNKTIFRILNEPSQSVSSKFEIACHYFLDKCTIINLYYSDKSEEEEKYFTSNPKFITDYSLYFWIWQIQGKRKLVTEASSFYLQFGNTWSRADIQNDVALLSIFHKAIDDNNETAVQYLWTNHVSKMSEKENMLSYAIRLSLSFSSRINICLYLLFQSQNNELNSLLKNVTYDILKNVIKNNRWHCIFINIFVRLKSRLSFQNVEDLTDILFEHNRRSYPKGIVGNIVIEYLKLLPISLQRRVYRYRNISPY